MVIIGTQGMSVARCSSMTVARTEFSKENLSHGNGLEGNSGSSAPTFFGSIENRSKVTL